MLQLAQWYAVLTQDRIIADVCQRESQGPEDTKSFNAITGPTCDARQRVQDPCQLRLVPPVLGWATLLAALSSAAPDLSTRLARPTLRPAPLLVPASGWPGCSSLSPGTPSRCPSCGSPMREIVGLTASHDHDLTANDKKRLRKFNDQVTPEQHNEYRLLHAASKAEREWGGYTCYQAGMEAANWQIRSRPRPRNQAALGQDDNTDLIPLRGKTCGLDGGGSPAAPIVQWRP